MNLVVAGKNSIAVDVLKHIHENMNIPVYVLLNRTENFKNTFQKSLGFYAKKHNIPIVELEEVYEKEDLIFLSLEFDRIIRPHKFKSQKLFNIHFSLLPAYKGMYTSALPILHGEAKTGVTLHKIDKGIDTGDIIEQREITIDLKNDTARTLYLKYIESGTQLVIDNLQKLVYENVEATTQSSYQSSYFSKDAIDYSNLKIDYNKTAFQIVNQLRAFSFREYQLPKYNDQQIGCWSVTENKSTKKPGTIVQETKVGLRIATIDFDLDIFFDQFDELIDACKSNNVSSLKTLLTNKQIDLEIKTKEGWTPLIISSFNGFYECVSLLLEAGANPNASNYNNTTVLMYAKTNAVKTGDTKIIDLLLEFGADLSQKDIYNKTVLDWVIEEDKEIYKYLRHRYD